MSILDGFASEATLILSCAFALDSLYEAIWGDNDDKDDFDSLLDSYDYNYDSYDDDLE